MAKSPAAALHKKTQDLLEHLLYRYSFFAFAQTAEKRTEEEEQSGVFQVAGEKAEPSSSGNALIRGFQLVNSGLAFLGIFVSFLHEVLHLLGVTFWIDLALNLSKHIRELPQCGGLFMHF